MKTSVTCPKCAHRRILHITSVQDKSPSIKRDEVLSVKAKAPLTVLGRWTNEGVFECYVCANCGYTEWYVVNAGELTVDGTVVRELKAPDPNPYR
jgi:predicted nucleic-acid-binding Zn-ribbon protein